MMRKISRKITTLVSVSIFLLVALQVAVAATDTDKDGIDNNEEQTLAETYAPVLHFEKDERVFPVAVIYHLSNSNLNKSEGDTPIFILANPSADALGGYTSLDDQYYLDNRIGTIDNDAIVNDYREHMGTLGYTVYAHVFSKDELTVIQYWFFYAFNNGALNNHEGDWEMVQVVLDSSNTPVESMYSQHLSGQRAAWSEAKKSGTHPIVYVARGSHANYFRYYQGMLGLASDRVGKTGKVLKHGDYELVILGERFSGNHIAEQNWIDFSGRWGDFGSGEDEIRGKRGPYGPVYREEGEMWNGVAWGESLPSLNTMVLGPEWFLYHFTIIYFAVLALSLIIILILIYRQHKKQGIQKPYFSLLRIDGLNMHSLGNILAIAGIALAVLSLFYPWYSVAVEIDMGSYTTPGLVEIMSIDGIRGLRINLLEQNSGMIQIGTIPIAFSLIIGAGILLFILGTIGAGPAKAGRKYVVKGIKFWVPIFLILLVIILLKTVAFQLDISGATEEATRDAKEILATLASRPFGGNTMLSLPTYGSTYVEWHLGTGAFMLIAAGIILIIAGILVTKGKKNLNCPSCKNPVEAQWKVCPNCGGTLSVLKADLVCPRCKNPVEPQWEVCPNCGQNITYPKKRKK